MIETQNKSKMVEGFCFSIEFFFLGCFLKTPKGHIESVVKGSVCWVGERGVWCTFKIKKKTHQRYNICCPYILSVLKKDLYFFMITTSEEPKK